MAYASQYYDPQKAHEYYMKNRELKGRRSTKGWNEDKKQKWAYVKNQINTEKKNTKASITANAKAQASLPWSVSEYKELSEQMKYLQGIPQVPGGYFTWRNVNNAFYTTVVSKTMQAREALTEYVRYINEEINYKRKEFNLPLMQ
jgi:hypothetical protein